MRLLFTILSLFSFAFAQHTSPTVNAGSDFTNTIPYAAGLTGNATLFNGATVSSYNWTKVKSPNQQPYSIVIVGSSTAAGFGVTTPQYFGTLLFNYYNPLGLVDQTYNAGENGGQTIFGANITNRLNFGGAHQRKIIIISYPSNGYNGSAYTNTQIMNRFREWRDSCINRGYEWYFMGTQPREDFIAADRTRLNVLNDSIGLISGNRFINTMKIAKNSGNDLWKTAMSNGDGVHGNPSFHVAVTDLIKAVNPFKYIVTSAATVLTPTLQNASVTGSATGVYWYQLGVKDSEGHGGSDIVQITVNAAGIVPKFRFKKRV